MGEHSELIHVLTNKNIDMKLIELNHVMSNGQTQIVLLDPNTFNYMENMASGYGSVVYYGTGCIDVTESPSKIKELINNENKFA